MEEQIERLKDTFGLDENGNPPDLCRELAAYLQEMPGGMTMIKHPLVNQIYSPIMNHTYNMLLEQKREAIEKCVAERDWYGIVMIWTERPWRIDAFLGYADEMSDQEYWKMAGDIWTDSENIYQNLGEWYHTLNSPRPGREYMMDEDERKVLAALPERITIYRGSSHEDGGSGLSWTLSREKAEWFARRLAMPGQRPRLMIGAVDKADVVAYFNGRSEEEIVVNDIENVEYLTKGLY